MGMDAECIGCCLTQQNTMKVKVAVKVAFWIQRELSNSPSLGHRISSLAAWVLFVFEMQP